MIKRFLLSLLLVTICLAAAPVSARAFDPFGSGVCDNGPNGANASAACHANGSDPIAGSNGILLKIANIIAYLGGAIAIIMILVASIRFITSGSDVSTGSRTDTDVEEAKRTVASAMIGLAVIILAKLIITYVVRKL